MDICEKISYIKGLAEGLDLDVNTKEGKVLSAIIDLHIRHIINDPLPRLMLLVQRYSLALRNEPRSFQSIVLISNLLMVFTNIFGINKI